MKIAISITPLQGGHSGRGTGVYTRCLMEALETYIPENNYVFFSKESDIPADTDLVHYPFFDPFFLTLPFWKPFPTVVTVHDLIPIVFPEKFPRGVRGSLKWALQKKSLEGARGIITDSETSRKDIIRLLGRDASDVFAVSLAPEESYIPFSPDAIATVRRKYNLPDRYLVYVGDVNWNKNVPGLLRVWADVVGKSDNRSLMLVLAGSAFMKPELPETKKIADLIGRAGIVKNVVTPGFIEAGDMPALYAGSVCAVVPSFYEGFGFPVLEAFASGTVVACSDRGSLAEIAGPAVMFDPDDAAAFAKTLTDMILLSKPRRSAMVAEGIDWAKRFTWKKTARATVKAYEEIIHRHTDV